MAFNHNKVMRTRVHMFQSRHSTKPLTKTCKQVRYHLVTRWLALQLEEDGSGAEEMKAKEYGKDCQQDFRPASALQMQRLAKTCLKVVPIIEQFWYQDAYHHYLSLLMMNRMSAQCSLTLELRRRKVFFLLGSTPPHFALEPKPEIKYIIIIVYNWFYYIIFLAPPLLILRMDQNLRCHI